jgi:hypothetical protein
LLPAGAFFWLEHGWITTESNYGYEANLLFETLKHLRNSDYYEFDYVTLFLFKNPICPRPGRFWPLIISQNLTVMWDCFVLHAASTSPHWIPVEVGIPYSYNCFSIKFNMIITDRSRLRAVNPCDLNWESTTICDWSLGFANNLLI